MKLYFLPQLLLETGVIDLLNKRASCIETAMSVIEKVLLDKGITDCGARIVVEELNDYRYNSKVVDDVYYEVTDGRIICVD